MRLLNGELRLRQVTRLKDGHQTPILTSRRDLSALEVAFRMFERWRQENFFKYLREEYLLDALLDYAVEPADPTREVPNPAWAEVTRRYLTEIADLIDSGGLRTGVGTVLPLADAREAHFILEGRRLRSKGKIVLTVGTPAS